MVIAFQSHHYYRTALFIQEFGEALGLADEVVVLKVHAPAEEPVSGASGKILAEKVPLPVGRVLFEPCSTVVPGVWSNGPGPATPS